MRPTHGLISPWMVSMEVQDFHLRPRVLPCSHFGLTPLSHIGKRCAPLMGRISVPSPWVGRISCRCGTKVSSQNGYKAKPLAWGENPGLPYSVLRTKTLRAWLPKEDNKRSSGTLMVAPRAYKPWVGHISCRCGTKVSSQNGYKAKPLA